MWAFLAVIEQIAASKNVPAPVAALMGRGMRNKVAQMSELQLRSELTDPKMHHQFVEIHRVLGDLLAELETSGDSDLPPAA